MIFAQTEAIHGLLKIFLAFMVTFCYYYKAVFS